MLFQRDRECEFASQNARENSFESRDDLNQMGKTMQTRKDAFRFDQNVSESISQLFSDWNQTLEGAAVLSAAVGRR